jgi:hypothetical protein
VESETCVWIVSPTYRPEFHYMRGPQPKWLEKHAFGVRRPGQALADDAGTCGARAEQEQQCSRRQKATARYSCFEHTISHFRFRARCTLEDRQLFFHLAFNRKGASHSTDVTSRVLEPIESDYPNTPFRWVFCLSWDHVSSSTA